MITGIWLRPDDPDEDDCVIIEYTDEEVGSYSMLLDSNGDLMEMDGVVPPTWTRVFPVTGMHQEITGVVNGNTVPACTIGGGLIIS